MPAVRLALGAAVSAGVAVALWFVGRARTPAYGTGLFGAHGAQAVQLKAELGSALWGLALVQLVLALVMYGRLPGVRGPAPRPVRLGHRLLGLAAFLLSLPIAVHCITTYGVETADPRVLLHSVCGCLLYGAFVAKVLVVRARGLPGWLLPAVGGLLVGLIGLLWYSAALWALNGSAVPGL